MPLYEYRCRTCDETFELRRPMSESSAPAPCSSGHVDSMRLLSVFASVGASGATAPSTPAPAARGGVCGSSCGCHH
jgi:putative FmdB family regulatory protein